MDPDDPMRPVFADLMGFASGLNEEPRRKDETSLAALLATRYGVEMDHQGVRDDFDQSDDSDRFWSMQLFGPGDGLGVFESLRSTTGAAPNGGAHYYFWVGAFGQGAIGMGGLGAGMESLVKWWDDASVRSRRQLRHYWCGVGLADELFARRGELGNTSGLSILSLDYPSAIPAGDGGDVTVTWGGNPTFPVALVLEPAAGCPSDCRAMSTFATSSEQPITGSGFLECKLSTQTVSYRYEVHLSDANGASTTKDPVNYTCLPTAREGIVNVSGGLDQASVDYQVKKWDDRGWTFVFSPSFASFQLLEDGTARISETIVFREDDLLRSDPTRNYGHIRRTFWTLPGRGTVESAGGKLWQCIDHVWYWGKENHVFCDDTWSEQDWSVRRQPDGSYLLTILNGMPAGYAEIPYRLK